MTLAAGDRLGLYEILAPLGAGGMGEVYRARDLKLHRDVAIKVLPDSVSADPDRVARFDRESRVLASLNHPNIAHIYGVEESGTARALVLELVEGPTLQERLGGRSLALAEALGIARQIAGALEAAHEVGIVHRDLKPANVKLRADGAVKVLDFGLAKALEPQSSMKLDVSASPTVMPHSVTRVGVILGTAGYMSPEQARGDIVDKRADIWAFGVVLFEMLTGAPLFARHTAADSVAAVLHTEPDWSQVPFEVRPLLQACLQKDPKDRLRDIGDARLLLERHGHPVATVPNVSRVWIPWTVAAVSAVAAAVSWLPTRTPSTVAQPVRFQISPAGDLPASAASAISPNGRYLAFLSSGTDRVMRVWIRDLGTLEDRPLQGTEIGQAAPPPFWSPDSRFIAYDAGGMLKKIEVSGGLAQILCELNTAAVGGTWNRDGVILFGDVNGTIMKVSDAGGQPSRVTVLDTARGESAHLTPVFLPDGRHFFYLRVSRTNPERNGIFLGSLDVPPERQSSQRLVATTTSPIYARGSGGKSGRLLFLRDGNLMSQTFDERRLDLSDTPILVSERVHSYLDTATVSASDNDILVYKTATQDSQLTWLDRQGRTIGRVSDPGLYGESVCRPTPLESSSFESIRRSRRARRCGCTISPIARAAGLRSPPAVKPLSGRPTEIASRFLRAPRVTKRPSC
jgi:serine/threonine protein kinase